MLVMKPLLYFFIVLTLFQSQLFGSLVKNDLPLVSTNNLADPLLQKQAVLDPFLLPDNLAGFQIQLSKNEWLPIYFKDKFIGRNISFLPYFSKISYFQDEKQPSCDIPVFIRVGCLRL
jgi:hypothetical protein